MVVVVRAFPDAARRQRENADEAHEKVGQKGVVQDGVVLVVVKDHKRTHHQQTGDNAANQPGRPSPRGQCPNERKSKQRQREKHFPPTAYAVFAGKRPGRLNQRLARTRSRFGAAPGLPRARR